MPWPPGDARAQRVRPCRTTAAGGTGRRERTCAARKWWRRSRWAGAGPRTLRAPAAQSLPGPP
eukprot:scaffold7568_cov820-Prasinococcus_capsulatus_cf.AAC.1